MCAQAHIGSLTVITEETHTAIVAEYVCDDGIMALFLCMEIKGIQADNLHNNEPTSAEVDRHEYGGDDEWP